MKTIITIYRWAIALFVMTITGGVSLLLVLISFGLLREFCALHILKYSSRFILKLIGFKGVYPDLNELPKQQTLYTFNHNSYADIFLLTGMGIPKMRYVLSESTYKYLPLVLSAKAIGTFYIPQKKFPKRRLRFFKRITNKLKKNNYSIYASSEGVHEHFHGIAPFNRGIYHMALEAKLPITLLYINIPEENNIFQASYAKGGTLKIEYMETVDTSSWRLETLDDHIEDVRNIFVNRFNELNPDQQIQ